MKCNSKNKKEASAMNKSKIANSCQLKNFESRLVDQVLDFTIKDYKISKK